MKIVKIALDLFLMIWNNISTFECDRLNSFQVISRKRLKKLLMFHGNLWNGSELNNDCLCIFKGGITLVNDIQCLNVWKYKMNCELMLTYDTHAYMFNVYKNQLSRQTGSRNLTSPKTLPKLWHTYMKLVTKYQISALNSCWEKYLGRTELKQISPLQQ